MKAIKLTRRDLLSTESNGYGYLVHNVRTPEFWLDYTNPYEQVALMDELLVEGANEAQFTVEQLQSFADSRAGRHMADALTYLRRDGGHSFEVRDSARVIIAKALSRYLVELMG